MTREHSDRPLHQLPRQNGFARVRQGLKALKKWKRRGIKSLNKSECDTALTALQVKIEQARIGRQKIGERLLKIQKQESNWSNRL